MNVKQISIMNFCGIREYHAEFNDGVVVIDKKNSKAITAAIDIVTSGEGLDALPEDALITAQIKVKDDVLFVTADCCGISAYCALENVTEMYRQMIDNRGEERRRRFFDGNLVDTVNCLDEYLCGEALPSESEVGSLPFFRSIIGQYLHRNRSDEAAIHSESRALQGYGNFIDTLCFWRDYKEMQDFHIEMQPVFVCNLLAQLTDERLKRECLFLSAAMHRQVFLTE